MEFVVIAYTDTAPPSPQPWVFPDLYHPDINGNDRLWTIGVIYSPVADTDGPHRGQHPSFLYTRSGFVRNPVEKPPRPVVPKGGKTYAEQAMQEARKKYNDKYRDKGYRPVGQKIEVDEPMLANEYMKPKMKNGEKLRYLTGKKVGQYRYENEITRWPVYIQAKIDGQRCLARLDAEYPNGVRLRSRLKNDYVLLNELRAEISKFFTYLPVDTWLDGELWTRFVMRDGVLKPEFTFQEVHSIIASGAKRDGSIDMKTARPEKNLMRYYIFDYVDYTTPYEERYSILQRALESFNRDGNINEYFTILPCYVANSKEDIDQLRTALVKIGYEGVMVRKIAGPVEQRTPQTIKESLYVSGRVSNLLKYKPSDRSEGVVVDIEEEGGGKAGLAMFVMRDEGGKIFRLRPVGDEALRRQYFNRKSEYIGKKYMYEHQGLTDEGMPRFPTGFGWYEPL
jgi:hypothetical protein